MTALTDTHRRAALRGRESLARWRIEGASWVGWMYGVSGVLSVVTGAIGGTGTTLLAGVVAAALCGGMAYGIHRMRQGSAVAACAVVVVPLLGKLLTGTLLSWNLWDAAVLFALVNGAWGTFQLAEVRRDAVGVPPAPEPRRRFGRAFG